MASKLRHKRWFKPLLIMIVLALVVGGGVVLGARRYYHENLKPVSTSSQLVEFTIPSGAALPEIAESLKEANLIRNKQVFQQYVRNNGADEDIKAGTYELSPSYAVQDIVAIITEGKIASNLITILPGMTLDQIKEVFVRSGFSAQEIEQGFDPAQYQGHPALVDKPVGASLEGYLYPESFQHTAQTTVSEIITASLDEMQKQLTPEVRNGMAAQNLNVYQGITLASIVAKEVSDPEDKHKVAQVFLRRLNEGKPLESDVTAFYGAKIDSQPESVSYRSPYNTYFIPGLPPSPISNVTSADLDSVVNPAATNYLYFVAGDDGNTYFSNTLAEHEALTQQHCFALCGR